MNIQLNRNAPTGTCLRYSQLTYLLLILSCIVLEYEYATLGSLFVTSFVTSAVILKEFEKKMDVVELNILSSSRATDYEICEVIGVGQNGVVVSARCKSRGLPRPQKLYAVKLLFNFTHEYSTLIRNAYENEWLVLSRLLPHQGIVRFWAQFVCVIPDNFIEVLPENVKGFATQKKRTGENSRRKGQFVVMDYHPRNATQWVDSLPHPLPLQSVLDFAEQVFQAAAYLEDNNICHLDLKLDNILVTDDNKFVLCDFGCAEQFPSEDKRLWYQRGSLAGGNKAHLAPEVQTIFNKCKRSPHQEGILDYNAQAPWAAAVLVYEVAIGSHPLSDYPLGYDNDGEILYKLKVTKQFSYKGLKIKLYYNVMCVVNNNVSVNCLQDLNPLPKDFPNELAFLLQSMVHPNPVRRPTLEKALQQLKAIAPSSRHIRLSGLSNELGEVCIHKYSNC